MKITSKLSIAVLLGSFSCTNPVAQESDLASEPNLPEGMWQGIIAQNDSVNLKFNFNLETLSDTSYTLNIRNAEEVLEAKMIMLAPDSFKIEMPVFANHFSVKFDGSQLLGFYINPDADDYRLPFRAIPGEKERYPNTQNVEPLKGYWRIDFNPGTDEQSSSLAFFDWSKEKGVYGTVMTATGDYRYLEGSASAGKLYFSAFDGAHLFHFDAELGDTLKGRFYSGRSYFAPWIAVRDSTFSLPDADTLTYLKEGFDGFDFAFPTLQGDTVKLSDERFAGKALIVQISGSWCPNCFDESRYLSEVYKQYQDKGLEIVCLSFERTRDYATAQKRLAKMQKDINIPYTVLLAGATRDDKAAEKLPMLNHVMSYPTAIYLDADHKVRKIHTGFSGPGTPVWEDFVSDNDAFLQKLIKS
jgi:thiol-disulfide isomerase/thioredoxin